MESYLAQPLNIWPRTAYQNLEQKACTITNLTNYYLIVYPYYCTVNIIAKWQIIHQPSYPRQAIRRMSLRLISKSQEM